MKTGTLVLSALIGAFVLLLCACASKGAPEASPKPSEPEKIDINLMLGGLIGAIRGPITVPPEKSTASPESGDGTALTTAPTEVTDSGKGKVDEEARQLPEQKMRVAELKRTNEAIIQKGLELHIGDQSKLAIIGDKAAGVASAAAQPGSPLAAVDRILEKLEFGNIAFNAPNEIRLDDTVTIQLLLGVVTPADELKRMVEAAGEKETARILVSDVMEARLSGANFAITAVTPERQAVTRTGTTEWKWDVRPTREGRQHLHLSLSVLIKVDGVSTQRAIRTFDKEIEVEVTWDQQVGAFVEENWKWLWATFLVPVAAWLWKKKKDSKASVSGSSS